VRRGEVWLSVQPSPVGTRPVLLVARDESYEHRDYVIIALITTRVRGLRAEMHLGPPNGLNRPSVVNLDTLNTIAKSTLVRRLGVLEADRITELDAALRFALGIED
jgi:mRNA interferase MazF